MRIPLAATAAALAFLPAPSHALSAGVAATPVYGTSFFRPGIGVAVAGACTYDGIVLAGAAAGVSVGGTTTSTSLTCTLYTAGGTVVGQAWDSGRETATPAGTVTSSLTPARLCATASASHSTWSHAANGTACQPVLPGPIV